MRGQLTRLCEGDFLTGATNVCIFGNPGVGKTHAMAAIGHELVRQGHAVFFTTVQAVVERLLAAKRDLNLARELRRLDRSTACASTTSATCSRSVPRWRCCSRCWRNATSAAAC